MSRSSCIHYYSRLENHDEENPLPCVEVNLHQRRLLTPQQSSRLAENVLAALDDQRRDSQLFDDAAPILLKIDNEASVLGDYLGSGGFCTVHAFSGNRAIKFLSESTIQSSSKKLMTGAMDLVCEANLLSVLEHQNIVAIRGTTCPERMDQYGILLERVETTLQEALNGPPSSKEEFAERLSWALQLACALEYLHSKRVIFRDLKLSNVGLTDGHQVKLLDFGLAKEMKAGDSDEANATTYRLSGKTGSYATWAPEVAKGWNYNEKVDVYSFGIVLYSLLKGEEAFGNLTEEQHFRRIVQNDERPSLEEEWNDDLKDLIRQCWNIFSHARPDMSVVVTELQLLLDLAEEKVNKERSARRQALYSAFLIFFIIIAAFALFLWMQQQQHQHQLVVQWE